ncbi:MAG TPA: sugar-binding transcriptional regulator [Chloroflexi bacterium]|nr:sugar-binding transcriptional regulator [Chloroflexota bacterium]
MNERDDLLAMVASLYYKLNQGQAEIAERLGVSTSKVSRLLKEAWERGIIEVQIKTPIPRDFALETQFVARFCLTDALILDAKPDSDEEGLVASAGQLAAIYLQRIIPDLPDGAMIGVAWGTGVHATVNALPNNPGRQIDVVQLMGGVGALVVDGPDLARMVAAKLGGRHYDLHAPVLVERPEVRDLFLAEPTVREGIRRARSVQLAITGIGSLDERDSSFLRAGLLTRADLSMLRSLGAVGETAGRFYDAKGQTAAIELNRRVIGVELEDLRRIPRVIAVARGLTKAAAILGALRGCYLDVLATDNITARAVMTLADEEEARGLSARQD